MRSLGAPLRPAETLGDRSAEPARSVPGPIAATATNCGGPPGTVRVGTRAAGQVQAVARYLLLVAGALCAVAARICVRISYMSMAQRISAAALCGRSSTRRWRFGDGPTPGAWPSFSGGTLEATRPGGLCPEGVGLCADPGGGGRRGPGPADPLAPWRGARLRRPMMTPSRQNGCRRTDEPAFGRFPYYVPSSVPSWYFLQFYDKRPRRIIHAAPYRVKTLPPLYHSVLRGPLRRRRAPAGD